MSTNYYNLDRSYWNKTPDSFSYNKILQWDFIVQDGGLTFCTLVAFRSKTKNIGYQGHFPVCDRVYKHFKKEIQLIDQTLEILFNCPKEDRNIVLLFGDMHEYGKHEEIKKLMQEYGNIIKTYNLVKPDEYFYFNFKKGTITRRKDNRLITKF